MTVLEDLWYGNINPHEQFLDGNTEYRKLLSLTENAATNSKHL